MKRHLITLAGILLAALVLYPLSAGPVARYLMLRHYPDSFEIPAFYVPLEWVLQRSPAVWPAWHAYMQPWMKLPPDYPLERMGPARAPVQTGEPGGRP